MFDVKKMGEQIARLRMERSYTQEQLADQIGVSTQFLSDAERGVTGMSVNTIVKLCGVLNISADFLLLGMEEPDGTESPLSIYTRMKRLSPQERELVEEVTNLMMKSFHLPK